MPDTESPQATMARQSIATEVRAELARQSKTQRDIADILGVPQSAVSLRLSGQRAFRAEELVILADALGVPVDRFLAIPAAAAAVAE